MKKEIKTIKTLTALVVIAAAITFTSCLDNSQEKKIKSPFNN